MQPAIVAKAAETAQSAAPQAEAVLRNQRGSPHKVPTQLLIRCPHVAAACVQKQLQLESACARERTLLPSCESVDAQSPAANRTGRLANL